MFILKKGSGFKDVFTLLTGLFFLQTINAQKTVVDSLQTLQDSRVLDIYNLTGNVAYSGAAMPSYGYASANICHTTGLFKQPMKADNATVLSLETGGFKKINNWKYHGYFKNKKTHENKVSWSGVYDAYDDNPFIWADSSSGDWERDEINALIGITTPTIAKKITAGLQIVYSIGSGARLSEPKPFFRYRNIALQPGFSWLLSNKQEIGITGKIGFIKEENELGFYNTSGDNVLLYRLRGYGTFSKTPFVSGERKRIQTEAGTTLHYKNSWKDYQLLLAINALQRDDEITEGIALPVTTGYFTGIEVGGLISLYKGNSSKGKSITINSSSKNGYADDMIFRAESASSVYQRIAINSSIWQLNNTTNTLWQYSFAPVFTFIDNTDQATLTQFTAGILQVTGSINYRRQVSKRILINASVDAGYSYVADDYFSSTRPNVITKELVFPNYIFYASNYIIANARFGINFLPFNKAGSHEVYLSTQNKLSTANSRNNLQVTYSIIL